MVIIDHHQDFARVFILKTTSQSLIVMTLLISASHKIEQRRGAEQKGEEENGAILESCNEANSKESMTQSFRRES